MRPTRAKTPKKKLKIEASVQDPIEVYCRIRPLDDAIDNLCVRIKDDKTVVLFPPEDRMSRVDKEKHFSFKHVFDETTTQKELFNYVCLPLVQDLLQGKNGLLFTYGITSSGKTYTMTGTPQNGGLLPRSLDVIFNSIKDIQAKKFVFKPNNTNGFEVQSVASAMAEQYKEIRERRNKKDIVSDWCSRIADESTVESLPEDSNFAVFISYVEIYNNYVYDLLEDTSVKTQTSKLIREDASKNMFVQNATVAEVKTVEEALELFYKGQVRRKVSHTALNTESSRSHSVFTIRVIQAPLDSLGAEVLQDINKMTVSQLSLVDLAGSERQVKSKTADAILREAGKINTSLMTLRKCIEELRNRQIKGTLYQNMSMYRESKLTQLFKTFFEGQGKIRMVVCINPQAHYFEELDQVLIFADKAQDVLIPRSTPLSTPKMFGFTPGRGQLYREAVRKAREQGVPVNDVLPPVVYSLGPDLPAFDRESFDESFYIDLTAILDARIMRREAFVADYFRQCEEFRNNLVATEKELIRLQQESVSQKMDLDHREQRIRSLEHQLSSFQEVIDSSEKEKWEIKRQSEALEAEVSNCKRAMSDYVKENERMRKKMQDQTIEKERWRRHVEKWMTEQAEMNQKLGHHNEMFRRLGEILSELKEDEQKGDQMMFEALNLNIQVPSSATSSEASAPVTRTRVKSIVESMEPSAEIRFSKTRSATDFTRSSGQNVQFSGQSSRNDVQSLFSKENRPPNSSASTRNMAVANPRHRRSTSMGDKWIEHKPIGNLELNTILQPAMKKKKSVSKLEVKDVTNNDKYLLQHQEQDSQGEVETQLFKADIIPSAGGGAQIIFNDVEKLRQVSPPPSYNLRKRSGENLPLREVEDRCTLSVECHGLPSKILKKK